VGGSCWHAVAERQLQSDVCHHQYTDQV
jgi:hypothetical protein